MAEHKATRRLHLITNGKEPDVFLGMSDASDPEPAPVPDRALADSHRNQPPNAEALTAS